MSAMTGTARFTDAEQPLCLDMGPLGTTRPIEHSTILITGATDGLGKAVATELARRGATVLVHGRDARRVDAALAEIREETGNARLRGYLADFSSLADVRRLGDQLRATEPRLEALVNNAGIGRSSGGRQLREESADGHELRFAVNYLAPFLLTQLVLPLLCDSAPARVVNVASIGQAPIDFDDVMLDRRYDGARAYARSKLALIMFSLELAERLRGDGVTVNCLHPGTMMPTKIVLDASLPAVDTLEQGVAACVRLVASPDLEGVSGRFFDGGIEAMADGQAYDPGSRRRLWALSDGLVGLQGARARLAVQPGVRSQ
jgi:NAD(P)-dependent dehydrogenase (short-subunit alcohol dehydrogenase family)